MKEKQILPYPGLEPGTSGLEVQRAIHCASRAWRDGILGKVIYYIRSGTSWKKNLINYLVVFIIENLDFWTFHFIRAFLRYKMKKYVSFVF